MENQVTFECVLSYKVNEQKNKGVTVIVQGTCNSSKNLIII